MKETESTLGMMSQQCCVTLCYLLIFFFQKKKKISPIYNVEKKLFFYSLNIFPAAL